MAYSNDMTKINGSYVPRNFVSDGEYAWFVEGFTSDTFGSWKLRIAPTLPNGMPNMQLATTPHTSTAVLPDTDLTMLRLMIGNVQRMCQGLPTIAVRARHSRMQGGEL